MKITEKVLVESERVIGRKCDVCGKVIFPVEQKKSCFSFCGASTEFYLITTGHNDWGNDSCDSIEYKDACSKECAQKIIDEYFKYVWDGIDSSYIEIEHEQM